MAFVSDREEMEREKMEEKEGEQQGGGRRKHLDWKGCPGSWHPDLEDPQVQGPD